MSRSGEAGQGGGFMNIKMFGCFLFMSLIACVGNVDSDSVDSVELAHSDHFDGWGPDDEVGMANTLGRDTTMRCALSMLHPHTRPYELGHVTSNTMPQSPFSSPVSYSFRPTNFLPGTAHGFNGEAVTGEAAHQGTQFDALGHFAYLPSVWDGTGSPPASSLLYYNGFTQADVKPYPTAPLARLGVENVPPLVTSAVLLDARTHLNNGEMLPSGYEITSSDIRKILRAQRMHGRGILPGDVVYIYTGWEDLWQDPFVDTSYYRYGPGLAYDAALYLADRKVVMIALDNPFTDPVNDGQLVGAAPPPSGCPGGLPFCIHHHMLAVAGIYQIQNAHLEDLAADEVYTSCTMVLPLRVEGGTGSPVRPVAYGRPGSRN